MVIISANMASSCEQLPALSRKLSSTSQQLTAQQANAYSELLIKV